MYRYDNRVVITLDAGGTNLVFGAMQANKFIVDPITLPSNADNLDKCLATMVEGFQAVIDKLEEKPVAISFAFPARPTTRTESSADTCPTSLIPRRRGAGAVPRIQIRHSGLHQQRRRPLCLRRSAGRRTARSERPARSAGQPQTLQESGGLHVRHGSGHRYRSEQRTQPRRQLVRRDFLSQAQEDADIIVEDGARSAP